MSSSSDATPTLRKGFVLLVLVVAGVAFLGMIADFVVALVLAGVFAGLLHRFFRWLHDQIGGPPGLAAAITLAATLLAVGLPLAGLTGIVVAEAIEVGEQVRPWMNELTTEDALSGDLPDWLPHADRLEPYRERIFEQITTAAEATGRWLVSRVSSLTQGVVRLLLSFFVMLYAMFFFLIDGPRLLTALGSYLPLTREDRDLVIDRGLSVTRACFKGIVVIGAIQGLLVGVGLWACGLTGAFFWGAVTLVLSAIPGLGAPIVWLPAAVYLGVQGSIGWGVGLALWGVLVVGLVDNLLRPRLVGRDAKLPDLVVLVSIFGGIGLLGPAGLLVGPLLAAFLDTMLEIYRRVFADWLPEA